MVSFAMLRKELPPRSLLLGFYIRRHGDKTKLTKWNREEDAQRTKIILASTDVLVRLQCSSCVYIPASNKYGYKDRDPLYDLTVTEKHGDVG